MWIGSEPLEGLSPRVRGNRVSESIGRLQRGSIPACAGEPLMRSHVRLHVRVYPRVCGGTKGKNLLDHWHWGLSPRVRGNLDKLCLLVEPEGSIPACAGEPSCLRSSR